MTSKKRPGKEAAIEEMKAQAKAIREQKTPTPSGEPHRIVPSFSDQVVTILNEIVALNDNGIDFLFQMLDSGMRDEWDCSLVGGIDMGFGPAEIRLAAKSGASTAKWIEEHLHE